MDFKVLPFGLHVLFIWIRQFVFGLILCSYFVFAADEHVLKVDNAVVGYFIQLKCFASEAPATDFYIVQWKKQGSLSPVLLWRKGQASREGRGFEGRVQLDHHAALVISDLRDSDGGLYDCQTWAVNGQPIGNASSTLLQIIDDIPKWIKQPNSTIVAPGSLAVFDCDTDPPAVAIEWLHNGKILTSETSAVTINKNQLVVRIDRNNQTRLAEQVGQYQCVAKWQNAALLSVPANLTIAAIHPFRQHDDVIITTQVRGNAVLQGFMPFSVPSAIPHVMHNGLPLTGFNDKKQLLSSGNLHIQDVSLVDNGLYRFSAFNPVTGETVTAKHTILLKVQVAEENISPQLLAAQQEFNTLVVGNNATLECAANGNPPPTISWSKYGGILPQGRHQQSLGNLLLFDLRSNDTGTYVCKATNGIGFPVSTISTLEVLEEPTIINWLYEYEIFEGDEFVLACTTSPPVNIEWRFNGVNIISESVIFKGNKIIVNSAQRIHAGFFQCFALSKVKVVMATTRVRVLPRAVSAEEASKASPRRQPPIHLLHDGNWGQSKNTSRSDADLPDFSEKDWQDTKTLNRKRNRKKNKHKMGANGDGKVVMIPPTRPEVTKLSDESVMVRWDVPPNSGLPIQFFKVQYRVVAKHISRWMTIDEDIPPHILSYEVPNLRTGQTYRFRIAAVYSNNDNKNGPNSHPFTLQKDPPMKKPVVGPVITETKTISPSAIAINWQYVDIEEVTIEGFFIYYRATTSAGTYTKVTVLGANTPSHIISHLLPDTSYDIKMQCFNSAGTSDFSKIHTEKTFVFPDGNEEENEINVESLPTANTASSNQLLYIILGSVLGTLVVILVLFVSYCLCKQKRRLTVSLNTDRNKENGEAQEMGQYTAANTSTTMSNGHCGFSTSIFLWQQNSNHVNKVANNEGKLLENNHISEKNDAEDIEQNLESHDSTEDASSQSINTQN